MYVEYNVEDCLKCSNDYPREKDKHYLMLSDLLRYTGTHVAYLNCDLF